MPLSSSSPSNVSEKISHDTQSWAWATNVINTLAHSTLEKKEEIYVFLWVWDHVIRTENFFFFILSQLSCSCYFFRKKKYEMKRKTMKNWVKEKFNLEKKIPKFSFFPFHFFDFRRTNFLSRLKQHSDECNVWIELYGWGFLRK